MGTPILLRPQATPAAPARLAILVAAALLGGCTLYPLRTDRLVPPPAAVAPAAVSADGLDTTYIIERPIVSQPLTAYPIRFQPGSWVALVARGCVDLGGHGATWRRYVDPTGPFRQRQYFGTVWIPGITEGPEPLAAFSTTDSARLRWRRVPALSTPEQLTLRLGYRDEAYRYWDNGYTGHVKNGVVRSLGNQCPARADTAAARVEVHVSHREHPEGPRRSPAPFDLMTERGDANGLPFNPEWAFSQALMRSQVHLSPLDVRPGGAFCGQFPYSPMYVKWWYRWETGVDWRAPECLQETRRLTVDQASRLSRMWCGSTGDPALFKGHINWYPVTYSGKLYWDDASDDGDYDFNLIPLHRAGETQGMPAIHVEFNAQEVVPRLSAGWWYRFVTGDSLRKAMHERPLTALVTGLFGLDAVHEAYSELHPVYAMALQAERAPAEHWALFVRQEGNEGECASDLHRLYLATDTFTFTLPWASPYQDVRVDSVRLAASFGRGDVQPVVRIVPLRAVLLSVVLPPLDTTPAAPREPKRAESRPLAKEAPLVHGDVYLTWIGALAHAPAVEDTASVATRLRALAAQPAAAGAQEDSARLTPPPPSMKIEDADRGGFAGFLVRPRINKPKTTPAAAARLALPVPRVERCELADSVREHGRWTLRGCRAEP